jgi:hypothetical protein
MIITRLIGGLGNQLFQYALGRHLADIHQAELRIDISGFETYKLHKYSLWAFNILENFASPAEVQSLTSRKKLGMEGILAKLLGRKSSLAKTHIREKKLFVFDPKILKVPDGVYLDGYWQSEKYFVNIEGIIRQEATVKFAQTGKDKELANMIASSQSVALHIRRADYVSNPKTKQVHGACDLDYYSRCVQEIAQTVKNPHFFIFSDDPEWAHDNLKCPYPTTLIDHNGADKNYEDLRLMSQCKHHIIANSSFSWWGAWLNPRTDKLVFAPKRWLAKSRLNYTDIIPVGWIRR